MKKITALILTAIMALSLMQGAAVRADELPDGTAVVREDAVETSGDGKSAQDAPDDEALSFGEEADEESGNGSETGSYPAVTDDPASDPAVTVGSDEGDGSDLAPEEAEEETPGDGESEDAAGEDDEAADGEEQTGEEEKTGEEEELPEEELPETTTPTVAPKTYFVLM